MFTVVIKVQGAVTHNPTYDWRVIVTVDGRQINGRVRRRKDPKDVRVSSMVSTVDGDLVEGRLVFARLVC